MNTSLTRLGRLFLTLSLVTFLVGGCGDDEAPASDTQKTAETGNAGEMAKESAAPVSDALKEAGSDLKEAGAKLGEAASALVEQTGEQAQQAGETIKETAMAVEQEAEETVAPIVTAMTAPDGEKVYKGACFTCHDQGVAGAPKLGDAAAWGDRIAQGMEALYNTALNGRGAMPPRGGNPELSDAAVKAAVDYMVSQSK